MADHVLRDSPHATLALDEFIELFAGTEVSPDPTIALLQRGIDKITDVLLEEFNQRSENMTVGRDKNRLLDPSSKLSANWDIYVAVLLIVTIFTMPLSMAFEGAQAGLKPLDLLADITFLLDIAKHFNTGYFDDFDYCVMDRAKVRKQYLITWFVPDALSSVPIEIIEIAVTIYGGGGSGGASDLRATKALKLLRLSRIAKVFRIMKLSKLSKMFSAAQDRFEDYYQVRTKINAQQR